MRMPADSKASISFTKYIHTPVVESYSYDYRYVEMEQGISLSERIKITSTYLPIFDKILHKKWFSLKNKHDCYNLFDNSKVPQNYLFKLDDLKVAIVIGRMFRPKEVPKTIRNKLWGTSITS